MGRINPITGIEHFVTDAGWEPQQCSFVSPITGNFHTAKILIPYSRECRPGQTERDSSAKEQIANFDKQMQALAQGLSEITKREIEWQACHDNNCAVWGDFGWFAVKK